METVARRRQQGAGEAEVNRQAQGQSDMVWQLNPCLGDGRDT